MSWLLIHATLKSRIHMKTDDELRQASENLAESRKTAVDPAEVVRSGSALTLSCGWLRLVC